MESGDEKHNFECDACGACCETFPVKVSKNDGVREPKIADSALVIPGWQQTETYYYQLHPLPFCSGCLFLGINKLCGVYETRPEVCREFTAGSAQCQEARARCGIPSLKPST